MFNIDKLHLELGSHTDRDKGVCAMEAVAWLAGEKHSDAPECANCSYKMDNRS